MVVFTGVPIIVEEVVSGSHLCQISVFCCLFVVSFHLKYWHFPAVGNLSLDIIENGTYCRHAIFIHHLKFPASLYWEKLLSVSPMRRTWTSLAGLEARDCHNSHSYNLCLTWCKNWDGFCHNSIRGIPQRGTCYCIV